jgi:glycosyltransferase involved in cell wall biosynthesis
MVISNSREGDKYWKRRSVPCERRKVVDNILSEDWFQDSAVPVKRDLVCYAGRLEPQKNVSTLVESFVQLVKIRPDTRCLVVGAGSLEASVRSIAASAVPGAIEMLAFQRDIRSVFERAAVFVNISTHEGKPNTVIENLALGNRVVLSRIPEHVDLVGRDYPFLVDTGASAEAIAAVLAQALSSPLSVDERQHARRRLECMRVERVADAYVDIFRELVEARDA